MNHIEASGLTPGPEASPGVAGATMPMVAKIASAVAAESSVKGASERIVAGLVDMGAAAAHVMLLDRERNRLVLSAQKGIPEHLVGRIADVALDDTLVLAMAARRRQIEIVPDVDALGPEFAGTRELLNAKGARSLVSVPLMAFGDLVGVLTWVQHEPLTLGEGERETLRSFAEIFALGIVNAFNVSALRRSNERFEEILDAAPIGMTLVSLDGRFVRPNRALCEMVGYTADELTKLRFQDITHPDDLATDLELAEKLTRGEIPRYSLLKRYIRKDGKIIEIMLHGSAVRDGGQVSSFIAQIVDVTQQRRHEAELLQSEERFRLLAENARDLIYRFRIGPNPGFEYVSPSAARITGYTPEDHYADPQLGFKIVHPDDRHILQDMMQQPLDSKPIILRWQRKNGEVFWVEQVNTPVLDASGNITAIEGIARDITDRKRAEEALVESEERLRFVVQNSPDAVFIQDLDLRYVWVANAMPGFNPQEFLGKTEFDLLPIAEAARLATLKRQVMSTGQGVQTTQTTTYKGKTLYMDARYAPWRDRAGEIIGVAGFARDITQSKLTEDALRAGEETLRMAQRVAHIGSWNWDLGTDQVTWSEEVFRIFGTEPCPVTFAAFLEYVPPEEHPDLLNRVREALSGGRRYELDHHIIRADGQVRVIHEQADVIGPPGEPQRMIGTAQDVTELRALEAERTRLLQALAGEKQWIELLVERSPIGFLLFDRQGKIRSNKRAETLFGRPLAKDKGAEQFAHQVTFPDGKPAPVVEIAAGILRGQSVEGAEFLIRRPDGSVIHVLGNATPVIDERGEVMGGVGVFEDITSLRQAERMREEWLGVIAHDLRQPLTAMAGNAELLKMRCRKDGVDREFDAFLAAIERMSLLTQELLDASVIEAKRLKISAERKDLVPLTDEILRRAQGFGADLAYTPDEAPVLAYVDARRYEQILFNLITNAVKYGAKDRPIQLHIDRQGPQAIVSVTNEGAGIQSADIPLVFERFGRTEGGKAKAAGLGLGLYIVKGLVEAHGGKVWVDSTPGETTTFSFSIPIAAAH